MSVEVCLGSQGCAPSPFGMEWVKEKGLDLEGVVERQGGRRQQCRRGRRGDGKESMRATLGACLVQAQAHCDYFRRLEVEKQLETDVFKEQTGKESKCFLEQRTERKLSQPKKKTNKPQTIGLSTSGW